MVTVTHYGNSVTVIPWDSRLTEACTNKRHTTQTQCRTVNGKRKFQRVHVVEHDRLYRVQGQTGFIWPGLFEDVCSELHKIYPAHALALVDLRKPLPEVNTDVFDVKYLDGQIECLDSVFTNQGGIVDASVGFGKTFLIGQICKAYPQLNILIVIPGIDLLSKVYAYVKTCANATICNGSHSFDHRTKVCVISKDSLHKVPLNWADLLLFDECHEAAAPRASEAMLKFNCRKFGFSGTHDGRSDKATKLLVAIFGPVRYERTFTQAVEAGNVVPLNVKIVPVHGVEVLTKPNGKPFFGLTADTEWEQWNIWRNPTRNGKIAMVSRMLQTRSADKILIMTNRLEHSLCLHALLPQFELVHGPVSPERDRELTNAGLMLPQHNRKPNTDKMLTRFQAGELRYVIATWKWKQGVDVPDLRHIIRADASPSEIPCTQIGGRAVRLADGKDSATLWDFSDQFGERMERRAKKRFSVYRKAGFKVAETSEFEETK